MTRTSRLGRIITTQSSLSYLPIAVVLLFSMMVLFMLFAARSNISPPHVHKPAFELNDEKRGELWTELLSWEPRAFIYHNFLSKEECDHLIKLAAPHLQKSQVVDPRTGKNTFSRFRTSSGMFLRRGQDKIIRTIEERIADVTFIPVEHGEDLQVLHYEVGQKYEPHYDYFTGKFKTEHIGQRIATLLMYLSDVEEGGETVFPSAIFNSSSLPYYNGLSSCAKKGLSVKPKRGDALFFWSLKRNGTKDPTSLHGGCPVIKGSKWSATKWMRVHKFELGNPL
ncbi:2-oxoglutarate (2OG) and Fe(II)-dependent oxygenase superfamily protein [Rhynchospora pubera]|uniref:procollagen-proline 4-dioxygenase n=1 Tax=Rhynchospora pubera TaxID=906938 RepID=A0AAV8GCJ8_9POAL|nr:2-oxoglutarate (2OG) and Fe(II)-dependent oxygenase superfamily protein [Rhynchospora pubera]